MGLGHSPSIIVDGLLFHIDPSNSRCYSGSGNTIYNLVNPSIGATFVGFTSNPVDNTEMRSIYFDGVNDYIDIINSSSWTFTTISICIWFKKNSGSVFKGVVDKGRDNYGAWSLCIDETANRVTFKVRIGGVNRSVTTASNYSFNGWTFIAGVYDGSTLSIYQNESLSSSAAYSGSIGTNAYSIRIGADNDGNCVNGLISSVSIYNKGLTAIEVLQNYNATRKKYYTDENIVTNGLVLHIDPSKNTSYPGTGNTIYDLSGSGITGTLTNGPTLSFLNGASIFFDGSNDYVELYSTSLLKSSPFSVSFWIYVETFGSVYGSCALSQYYTVCGPVASYLGYSNTFMASIQTAAGGNAEGVVRESNFAKNRWYYYCSVYDGSAIGNTDRLKIFIDGVQKSLIYDATVPSTPYTVSSTLALGYPPPSYPYFNGRISNLQIYNKPLTQQEILQNYNATKNRFINLLPPVRDGLVLELDAANRASYSGTGNTWYDLSGSNYHATLTNGPTFSGFGNTSNLLLDGTNDYIISDVNKTILGSSFTISFLFSTSSSSGGLLEISDSLGTGVPFVYLKRESSSQIYWYLGENYRLLVSLASNENALMSITYSNNLWTMYKNGVLQGTSSVGLGSFGGNNLRLGVGYHGYTATKWNLFTINNRALSAYEVKQNFDFYRTRYNI